MRPRGSGRISRRCRPGARRRRSAAGRASRRRWRRQPDWRGLLDLLEAHSATSFDDLWRTWVARDTDLALLDARSAARARYDAVVAAAGDWRLPRAVRDAMRAWQFDQATRLLTSARTILDQRAVIATAAAASGLTLPTTLRTAFESPDGFASATLEATAELEAIDRYDAAAAARPDESDPLVRRRPVGDRRRRPSWPVRGPSSRPAT